MTAVEAVAKLSDVSGSLFVSAYALPLTVVAGVLSGTDVVIVNVAVPGANEVLLHVPTLHVQPAGPAMTPSVPWAVEHWMTVLTAAAGPSFVTVMVFSNVPPATTDAGADSWVRRFAGATTVRAADFD